MLCWLQIAVSDFILGDTILGYLEWLKIIETLDEFYIIYLQVIFNKIKILVEIITVL
ncbi:hypothetical protein [Coxiella-like endosymbiont]|uniref:hypothetical protein n=1 Tax=Coxiella-like endosymbiont TaxID=1592897 RepID=UPI0028688D23|nr:hypothetical protein [Coxiella-like endosymbiont]